MTGATLFRSASPGCFGRGYLRAIAVLAVVGVLLAGLGLYLWHWRSGVASSAGAAVPPEPPRLAIDDPAVDKLYQQARAAVVRDPLSGHAWGHLGLVLHVHFFWAASETCFAEAERLADRDPRWSHMRGVCLTQTDPEGAIREFRRAADLCDDKPDAPRLRLGDVLLSQRRFAEARAEYQRVLEQSPGNARAYLGLGRAALLTNDLPAAEQALTCSVADPRTRKASNGLLAELHERQGHKTQAAEHRQAEQREAEILWWDPFLEESLKLKTGKKAFFDRAFEQFTQGRFADAAVQARQLTAQYPEYMPGWLVLGKALLRLGDLEAAEVALRTTLRLAPDTAEAYFYLGLASALHKHYVAAVGWYRKATELRVDYTRAYYELGHCLALQGDRAGALEAFRSALRCQPELVSAHNRLGDLLARQGQYAEALKHLRLALQLEPDSPETRQLLARLLGTLLGPSSLWR